MTTQNTTTVTDQPRDFVAFLLEQSQGKTNSELSAGLRDLAERVTETGKERIHHPHRHRRPNERKHRSPRRLRRHQTLAA